jgi:hypothetical protein
MLRVYDLEGKKRLHETDAGPAGTWAVAHHPSMAAFASGTRKGAVVVYSYGDEGAKVAHSMESTDGKVISLIAYNMLQIIDLLNRSMHAASITHDAASTHARLSFSSR